MNDDIRMAIKKAGLRQWQVAIQAGVDENTLIRWLRRKLTGERYRLIMTAIQVLEAKKEGE